MRAASRLCGALRAAAFIAGLASLGVATPSPAAAQDTVFVEWLPSANGKQVVLNAYRMREGRIAGDSVAALLIERNPTVDWRRDKVANDRAYLMEDAEPFLSALQWPATRLDSLATENQGSSAPARLSQGEWKRLLDRILAADTVRIQGAPYTVAFRRVPPVVERTLGDWDDAVFRGTARNLVLPYLQRGWIGPSVPRDTLALDSAAVAESGRNVVIPLRNYGRREATAALSLDNPLFTLQPASIPIGPGEEAAVTVVLPDSAGEHEATLTIQNAAGAPVQMKIIARIPARGADGGWVEWLLSWPGILLPLAVLIAGIVLVAPKVRKAVGKALKKRQGPRGSGDDPAAASDRHNQARRALDDAIQQLQRAQGVIDDFVREDEQAAPLRRQHEEVVAQLRQLFPDDFPPDAAPGDALAAIVQARLAELVQAHRERTKLEEGNAGLQDQLKTLREDLSRSEEARTAAEGKAKEALALVDPLTADRKQLDERLQALSQQLQLEPGWLENLSDPDVQAAVGSLRQGYRPAFLAQFQRLVDDLVIIYGEVSNRAEAGNMRDAVRAVLQGPKGNAGLVALQTKLGSEDSLLAALEMTSVSELRGLTIERFYEKVMVPDFKALLDEITRLGLYARVRENDIEQWLNAEGIDRELLDRALHLVQTRLRTDFGVSMHTVALFRTQFNEREYESASGGNLLHLRSGLSRTVERLEPGTIFDITSVGLAASFIDPGTRSVVAWRPPR